MWVFRWFLKWGVVPAKLYYHDPKISKLLRPIKEADGWENICKNYPQADHPIYPKISKERVVRFLEAGYGDLYVLKMLSDRASGIVKEKTDPLSWGWEFAMWKEADELWNRGRELLILGGNRCLGGETEIYDPVLGISRRVDSINGPHHVLAWDGAAVVVARALAPFTKGIDDIFRIQLSDGSSFSAASSHLVCDAHGLWRSCGRLLPGDGLFHLGSNLDNYQPVRALSQTNRQTLARFGHPSQSSCEWLPEPGERVSFIVSIEKARTDTKWDFTVPTYGNYFAAGCLHKNSSKSNFAAKRVIQRLIAKPGVQVWCFSTTFETSVRDQQRLIWAYLPGQWKTIKRSRIANISYTQKGGFSMKAFVCPNGSECRFMNYAQDSDVIEGGQIDLWWADELIPADWIVTLRSRVIDRRGMGLVTQTPIKGYTQTVAEYLAGARVTEWADCDFYPNQQLWPGAKPGRIPYKMQCLNPQHHVMFFHSKNNPYVPYEDLVSAWKDKGTANVLCRLYGVTSGVSHAKFPRFGAHNIIAHEKIPQKGTNYHVVDFSWQKPWAMLWARVQRVSDKLFVYIYRDWPDMDSFGEWALRSDRPDGTPGPAQHPCGYGVGEYKRLILDLESYKDEEGNTKQEEIFSRYGDPRSGNSTALIDEGATSIFQMLEAQTAQAPPMLIEPVTYVADKWHITEGVNMINEWLYYDVDQPVGPMNSPTLFVSERCQNLIACLNMWAGVDMERGASKDFVDLLRYLCMMDPDDHANAKPRLHAGGSY